MMKESCMVWEEDVLIPTYEIGEPEKNPMFLEKRVYQGSSGKVYPYPTIEKIYDEKVNKLYKAVFLENEYIRVMILPELGGRIQRAYDKTNDYDFVYYNKVIKPALVGLTGPWISGGIEFNWPQHHRPTTFLPVDYKLEENVDGSRTLIIHDVDRMYGTKALAKFTLYPGKAYIEIEGQLYNRTPYPQTFLWWANPAVAVNDYTASIFPPDVHAVMDHGKRDVSRYPIATGVYYKQDYSEGVDISRYKNIPVPTSYMAEKSEYDFIGGYDYKKEAGILHVANNHISPGKKQWTWGCGDFGKAWDRNLTDDDGPYIELMTGVYTDNQPDFTWLKPFEEKNFKQYFMPYKGVGEVKNATIDAVINLSVHENLVKLCAYATHVIEEAIIRLTNNGSIVFEEEVLLSPNNLFKTYIHLENVKEGDLTMEVLKENKVLVSYTPQEPTIPKLPEPAKAVLEPKDIISNEELYLAGLHLEQYRHATYKPEDYYQEGLKRDPYDSKINNAYGLLLMGRGNFEDAKKHFENAIKRLTKHNPNPFYSEPYFNLGLALLYQWKENTSWANQYPSSAYDAFYKATWSNEQQEKAYYYLAVIESNRGEHQLALELIEKALIKNLHNIKGRGLKAYILRKLGKSEDAMSFIKESLVIDPFDYIARYEMKFLDKDLTPSHKDIRTIRDISQTLLMIARDYMEFGGYIEALHILENSSENNPLVWYYVGYCYGQLGNDEKAFTNIQKGDECPPDYCFPNDIEDIFVLEYAIKVYSKGAKAYYYIGNLYYDKLEWDKATSYWEKSAKLDNSFPTVWRNLALSYYNKKKEYNKAKEALETAFRLDKRDARILLELDQLYKRLGKDFNERLEHFKQYIDIIGNRDDLYIEYITLINMTGGYKEAFTLIMNHKFHPWEGGEGKITFQYTTALINIAKDMMKEGEFLEAKKHLEQALVYPENLSEGKLEGTKDNHIYYYLGCVYEQLQDEELAKEYFIKGTKGNNEPAGMMYYNDQPADMILYQGLSYLKLDDIACANARFYKLIDYGEKHLFDDVVMDYFAVSLPDFLIFDDCLTKKNKAHCYYLLALGNIGINKYNKALEFLEKTLSLDPSHLQANLYYKDIKNQLIIW